MRSQEKVIGIYYTADNKGKHETPTQARRSAMAMLAQDETRFDISIKRIVVTETGEYENGSDIVSIPHWAGDKLCYGASAPEHVTIERGPFGIAGVAG